MQVLWTKFDLIFLYHAEFIGFSFLTRILDFRNDIYFAEVWSSSKNFIEISAFCAATVVSNRKI